MREERALIAIQQGTANVLPKNAASFLFIDEVLLQSGPELIVSRVSADADDSIRAVGRFHPSHTGHRFRLAGLRTPQRGN